MSAAQKHFGWVCLAGGLLVGVVLGGVWPHVELHAVATDRQDSFAIATGHLDEETEAIYFLDFITGELKATALSPIVRKFFAAFDANVINDLGIDPARNPKFMLVTGDAIFRQNGGQIQPGNSAVYVAELTSGKVAAYAVPWSQAYSNSGRPIKKSMVLLDVMQFRSPAIEGP